MRFGVYCFVLAMLVGVSLFGQEFRGSITGNILDQSGAPVSTAKVSVKNLDTNEVLSQLTGDEGSYTIPYLTPGRYDITVEAPGFKRAVRELVELHVNDRLTSNFDLEVGGVQETVTVTADPPMLDEATTSRGGLIENMRVTELPLNGRNPFALTNLSTGVVFAGNPQFTRPFDNGENVNFSINGGLRQTNSWLLDGIPDESVTDADNQRTRSQQNIAYIPTVDATAEFKILTNFYDAQYGRTGGGIINVTTKSGTNELHGTLYEFLRRYELDANSIQNNAAGRPRYGRDPVTRANIGGHKLDQFGGQLTGPVYLPNAYNGRDRTFFSMGFEQYLESSPAAILTSVPSLAMRNGDFSALGVSIYNPLSTRVNPNFNASLPNSTSNPLYIRDPFVGNLIPQQYWNQVGRNLMNAYPGPNTGAATAFTNNFIASPNISSDRFRNYIARVDHNFSEHQRVFFRYAHNRRNQVDNGANGYTGIGRDAQDPLVRLNDNAVADSLTVIAPTMLLDIRVGYTRFVQAAYRDSVQGFDASTVGFPSAFSASRFNALPPRIEMDTTYPTFGTRNPSQNTTNLISLAPSLSWIKGRHSFRFGADLRDYRANVWGASFLWGAGQFRFTRSFTQRLPEFAETGSGSAMASLLLGFPENGVIQYSPALAYRWGYYGLYIQDDIRVTPKLTVNAGLRFDIEGSPTERYNRMNRGFASNTPSPLASAVRNANPNDCPSCANLTGGLLFVSQGDQPREPFDTDYNHWQPRIGAAYAVRTSTVVRGGFGVFYLPEAAYGGSLGFAADTPFISTIGGGAAGFTPATSLSNPFPNGLVQPTGASAGLNTALGSNIIFSNPDRKIPHVNQWSIGIQQQLPWSVRVDASYVGSRSYDINTNSNQAGPARNLNVLSAAQLQRGRQDPSYLTGSVSNPFQGLIPNNSTLNAPSIQRQFLLLPYPQFGQVQMAQESVGRLWYDSLQLSVEKRYSSNMVFALAYTWSKNLDATAFLNSQDAAPIKTLAPSDRTHRLVLSGVFQLPFGRGRKVLGSAGRPLDALVGGWEYNFVGIVQSGTPMNYSNSVDLIGNPVIDNSSNQVYFNGCVRQLDGTALQPDGARKSFVPCSNPAWAIRGPNTLVSIPFRSSVLRNPWRPQWDMSLNKSVRVVERMSAQVRIEAFNVFNTPILGGPNTTPTDLNFGYVAPNQSNFPRNVQIGIKLNF